MMATVEKLRTAFATAGARTTETLSQSEKVKNFYESRNRSPYSKSITKVSQVKYWKYLPAIMLQTR